MKDIKLYLDGLNCANCAGKIEDKVNKLTDVMMDAVEKENLINTIM